MWDAIKEFPTWASIPITIAWVSQRDNQFSATGLAWRWWRWSLIMVQLHCLYHSRIYSRMTQCMVCACTFWKTDKLKTQILGNEWLGPSWPFSREKFGFRSVVYWFFYLLFMWVLEAAQPLMCNNELMLIAPLSCIYTCRCTICYWLGRRSRILRGWMRLIDMGVGRI